MIAIERALAYDLDVETDVRISGNEFVIKHDAPNPYEALPRVLDVLALLERYNHALIALHFKYDDWKQPQALRLLNVLEPYSEQVFLFDMSLEVCRIMKQANPRVKVGVSVGDKWYHDAFAPFEQALASNIDIIWADENRSLYSSDFIKRCHVAGKKVYCISPDLAEPVGHPYARHPQQTWRNLITWGADGICTDSSLELQALCRL